MRAATHEHAAAAVAAAHKRTFLQHSAGSDSSLAVQEGFPPSAAVVLVLVVMVAVATVTTAAVNVGAICNQSTISCGVRTPLTCLLLHCLAALLDCVLKGQQRCERRVRAMVFMLTCNRHAAAAVVECSLMEPACSARAHGEGRCR